MVVGDRGSVKEQHTQQYGSDFSCSSISPFELNSDSSPLNRCGFTISYQEPSLYCGGRCVLPGNELIQERQNRFDFQSIDFET